MKKHLNPVAFALLLTIFCGCEDSDEPTIDDDSISLELVAENLTAPLLLVEAPGDNDRLFIIDQPGLVYLMEEGEMADQPFLDIRDRITDPESPHDERGLLGLAFHPNFENNGRFYVYYSSPLRTEAPAGWDHTSRIAEYTVTPSDGDIADPATEKIILSVDQPQANHNAGMIAFGDDGYLYISLGDGGGADDNQEGHVEDWYEENEGGNGQDITESLLGSILRLDVDQGETYGIPTDNPFVGEDPLDEIYAYGFRNPYRFCFDPDGNLIVADAGQDLYEEVNFVEMGGNYGWNVKEGTHCFNTDDPETPLDNCPAEDEHGNALTDPVIEFKNSSFFSDGLGNVVVGGFVYEGDLVSFLNGKYIFGVLAQTPGGTDGTLFAADRSGDTWSYDKLIIENMNADELGELVIGFGQDNEKNVYVLTRGEDDESGKVYRIDNKLL